MIYFKTEKRKHTVTYKGQAYVFEDLSEAWAFAYYVKREEVVN